MSTEARMLIDGEWQTSANKAPVRNPYTGAVVSEMPMADSAQVERALQAAYEVAAEMRSMPAYRRAAILRRAADLVEQRGEELARLITEETGKTLRGSRVEVDRSLLTLRMCAEEAVRIAGEQIPLDLVPGSEKRLGFTIREPIGVVAAITPFNAPFNLICHKVGPAIAAGNATIVKPAPQAPRTGQFLGEVLLEAGLPPAAINIVYGGVDVGLQIVKDDRVALIAFTGSARAGLAIRDACGFKKLILELGSNAGVYVHADARLDKAVPELVKGAFFTTGQACISTQRIYVHESIFAPFTEAFVQETARLRVGDPTDPSTDVGPVIDEAAARRIEQWIQEAVQQGARVLCGGTRQGALVQPTVLTDVAPAMKVVCEEVFGPLVSLLPVSSPEEALRQINDTPYGLQAGVFTQDIDLAFRAARQLRVGGVMVNDSSRYRIDTMPFGGVKLSGIGREGPRFSVEQMTETKLIILNLD